MNAHETAQACYSMAYFVLPEYAFNEPENLLQQLNAGRIGAMFFYLMTCKINEQEPDESDAETMKVFAVHTGDLDERHRYHLIQYPVPTPIDLSEQLAEEDPERMIEAMKGVVLAPYLSAVVREKSTGATRYYVLGQSLEGNTTIRTVTPEMNANLGPGCEPVVDEFISLLRQSEHAEPRAALVFSKPPPQKKWWEFWK